MTSIALPVDPTSVQSYTDLTLDRLRREEKRIRNELEDGTIDMHRLTWSYWYSWRRLQFDHNWPAPQHHAPHSPPPTHTTQTPHPLIPTHAPCDALCCVSVLTGR